MKIETTLTGEQIDGIVTKAMDELLQYAVEDIWEDQEYAQTVHEAAKVVREYFGGSA